jgi:Xaa-Pro dipeptidase
VRSWESPKPEDEGVSLLASTIGEVLGQNARIGVPQGPETHLRMPIGDFHRLREMLPGCEFVDATRVITSLRMIKSAAEIEKIAHACTMVSDVFEAFPDQLRLGMSEIEIFRRFKIACLERGIDDVDYLVGGAGPGGYMDIISPPSPRGARAGDILMLDTGSVFDGYFCDFDRNFAFGPVSSAAERAYAALLDATQAGLEATRPGRLAPRSIMPCSVCSTRIFLAAAALGVWGTVWACNSPNGRQSWQRTKQPFRPAWC